MNYFVYQNQWEIRFSKKKSKLLNNSIKKITSLVNCYKTIQNVIFELCIIVKILSNYFFKNIQVMSDKKLNWIIYKRLKIFFWKKFNKIWYKYKLQKCKEKYKKWCFFFKSKYIKTNIFRLAKNKFWNYLYISRLILNELSFLIKEVQVNMIFDKIEGNLYYKQNGICCICKYHLFNNNIFKLYRNLKFYVEYISKVDFTCIVYFFDTKFHLKQLNYIITNKNINEFWYYSFYINYNSLNIVLKIPFFFNKKITNFKNKQLIHKYCYIFYINKNYIKFANIILKIK